MLFSLFIGPSVNMAVLYSVYKIIVLFLGIGYRILYIRGHSFILALFEIFTS